jgi:iron(III) transport system ATP-binding protein
MTAPAGGAGLEVAARGALKRYGPVTALDGVDFDLAPGRFVVLLGPSGSGKSTLARCLAGVERLDGGTLHLGDQLVGDHKRHLPPERRNLAMVFQDYALWPHLTALGNVSYALRRLGLSGSEGRQRAMAALERVGLHRHAERYPHELSGGEQQRVALARAVVARPGLLLFDEPLSNLDADLRERLRVEIATLTRDSGATAVYITHDQSEAFALADDMAVLDSGRIVQFGSPEEIYQRPATPFVARFTGLAGELPGRVVSVDAAEQVVIEVAGTKLAARNGGGLRAGERAAVFVRPAATRIIDGPPSAGTLVGMVVDVAYRGRGYDHVVACHAGSLTAVFDTSRHERGSGITVGFDPDGCIAYPCPSPTHTVDRDSLELTAVTLNGRV